MCSMSLNENRIVLQDYNQESDFLGKICRDGGVEGRGVGVGGEVGVRGPMMEAEKRIRREIANSNERRRMQSINAGFQSLRTLLPHHEGEKLSKAAILQQTAEYIYSLEQEKTRLLSQNSQLMRQIHQHENSDIPIKKRKTEVILPTIGCVESADEGLGSMSPEPVALVAHVVNNNPPPPKQQQLNDLRRQLDRERALRLHLEEQIRNLQSQVYTSSHTQIQYQDGGGGGGVIDFKEEFKDNIVAMVEDSTMSLSVGTVAVPADELQLVSESVLPPVAQTQTIVCSPQISRSPSPAPSPPTPPPRLPSALEAAIKAEPKVEVERLPTAQSQSDSLYSNVANTSRQNLETIVEAIRHLEGDHMFQDEPIQRQQEAPLALTNKPRDRLIALEMNSYLRFHSDTTSQNSIQRQQQQQQQHRPGVIVVKQNS